MQLQLRRLLPTFQGSIGWTALIVTCVSALLLGANRPVGWLTLGIVTFVLFSLQILRDLSVPEASSRFRRLWPAALLWIGTLLWALIQAIPSPIAELAHPSWGEAGLTQATIAVDPEAAYHGVWRLLTYAALFWIAVESARDASRLRAMLAAVALWSVLLATYGTVAFIIGANPILGGEGRGAVSASFVGPNAYALYAGFGMLCCLTLILLDLAGRGTSESGAREYGRNLLENMRDGGWLLWAGVAVTAAAAFYSGSRAGTASVLIGILVLIFCAHGKRQRGLRWIMGLTVLTLMSGVVLGASTLINDLMKTDLEDTLRATVYAQTFEAIKTSPWLGYGLGSYREAFRGFMTPETGRLEFDFAHNSYLENAFELGIPGALALYLALLWIVVQIWRGLAKRQRWRALPALGIAVTAASGLHALVDFSLQMPASAGLAAILLGFAWSRSYPDPSTRRKRSRSKGRRPQKSA